MYRIKRITTGLWYLWYEGKVRLEWVHRICDLAGIDCDALVADKWHDITVPGSDALIPFPEDIAKDYPYPELVGHVGGAP